LLIIKEKKHCIFYVLTAIAHLFFNLRALLFPNYIWHVHYWVLAQECGQFLRHMAAEQFGTNIRATLPQLCKHGKRFANAGVHPAYMAAIAKQEIILKHIGSQVW
jgi:hypothetical protein